MDDPAPRLDGHDIDGRYEDRGRLGIGAMGDVRLCGDRLIGREIALKVAVREGGDVAAVRERFVREARVQARLEHPSIVPVYDMGTAGSGAPYFTMKRVHGVTLRRVLKGIASGSAEMSAQFSRRRLLSGFASVCLTVEYAHGRGVVHRDLKPENVMLGTHGELYVLDWGIAREVEAENAPPGDHSGTAGYVAPEVLRGSVAGVAADVYALGAILFEILALERLHPSDAAAALASTLRGADARPSVRSPQLDMPPELDDVCVAATAVDPADRPASARALFDAVDRFLEGDRDLERRRELSASITRAAGEVAERALGPGEAASVAAERTRAMGEVSRALALDPGNSDARHLLLRLLTEPPRELPPEVEHELSTYHHAQRQRAARGGAFLFLGGLLITPGALSLMNARLTWIWVAVIVLFAGAAAALFHVSRADADSAPAQTVRIMLAMLALSSLSAVSGSLILVPSLVMTAAIAFLMQARTRRSVVIVMSCVAVLLPISLEWFDLVSPAYVVREGLVIVQNRLVWFTEITHGFLIVLTLVFFVVVGLYFIRFRDMLTDAERRVFLHAWHLRQLVPQEGEAPGDRRRSASRPE